MLREFRALFQLYKVLEPFPYLKHFLHAILDFCVGRLYINFFFLKGYRGISSGKGSQAAKPEIEKLDFDTLTSRQAVEEVAKMQSVSIICDIYLKKKNYNNKNWYKERVKFINTKTNAFFFFTECFPYMTMLGIKNLNSILAGYVRNHLINTKVFPGS